MKQRGNKYAGPCRYCGEIVPAQSGLLTSNRNTGAWEVQHRPAEWTGSPVSGCWVGGCPVSASAESVTTGE